jgi:UDP-N-acetylmuramate: L-alanyl-gamma-D-glutamyl-meso-diaminopimelate ligase
MQSIHFIAIGGSAMHNLALALHHKGLHITGSDDEIREPSKSRLAQYGLLPEKEGWFEEKINQNLDAVILGMHARKDNPELLKAQSLGIKIFSYPEFLYEQTKNKKRVVIGGSHGKTTITSMILHVLKYYKKDFDYMVGAQIESFDTMVRLSHEAPIAIFEGDEYLTSPIDPRPKFHLYKPHIAVLSGIAWDHINVFPSFEIYKDQFAQFIKLIETDGYLFYSADDLDLSKVVNTTKASITKVPYSALNHKIENTITYIYDSKNNEVALDVFGKHNLMNMAAALNVCEQLDISKDEFIHAIKSFKGAARRLEKIGENTKIKVYKDFAHSPSKVKATIKSINEQFTNTKTIALLELHTFSSLNANFLEEYNGAMDGVSEAIVYFNPKVIAHKKLSEISIDQVKQSFQREDLQIFIDTDAIKSLVLKQFHEAHVIVFMTSGNFDGLDLNLIAKEIVSLNT